MIDGPAMETEAEHGDDVELPVSLDDRLLSRELKQRLFGREATVRIGRYEVLERIGSGGMGTVYRARDPELSRMIALKVLRVDRTEVQWRMLTEARALARLSHPNVVTVHEVGTHDDRVYLAMEYVEGPTLRQWLSEPRTVAEIRRVFAQAARGLAAAHQAGLVHRDFKPDNVILGEDGRVRVVDFGVVKAGDEPEAKGSVGDAPVGLTATGKLLGTPAYMAAEQFDGGRIDARADVFALCVSLYEAFASERPFSGSSAEEVARAVTRGEATPLRVDGVEPELARLVERGLRPEADERPSLEALLQALEPEAQARARPGRLVAAVVLLLGVIAAVVWATSSEPRADDPPEVRTAFADLERATDDDTRLELAEAFVERFGAAAHPARRAVAHATIGTILWRRSCDEPWLDLCVRDEPIVEADSCRRPRRGPLTRIARDTELVQRARTHLRAASELAGIEAPEDPALGEAWRDAIGAARVQLADAEFESYVGIAMPSSLDFEGATALSSEAFKLYFTQMTEKGGALLGDYRNVKSSSPRWQLVAAVRTGLVFEVMSETFAAHVPPASFDTEQRRAYCDELDSRMIEGSRKGAEQAYDWCIERAREEGLLDTPSAAYCAERRRL